MTTFTSRPFALGVVAVVALAGAALAQSGNPILNTLEVRTLVASNAPADNAKLSAHFGALADQYTAEAARHTQMAQSYTGNPNHNTATGMSVHCKRLAELNTESATTLRELAEHHQKLVTGAASTAPRAGARFQGGAGAPEPAKQDLAAMAARAATPADHRGLAEYFTTLSARYTETAKGYAALAQAYRGTKIAQAATNVDRLSALARDSAKEATAAAQMHTQLANIAR
jgi:hypothetical protein